MILIDAADIRANV